MIHKHFLEINGQPIVRVTFRIPNGLWANAVYLVGDFNNWRRTTHPFQYDEHTGQWVITVDLEAGRAYQFRYLRDHEQWLNEFHADAYVVNPYGSDNFVVVTDPKFKQYCDNKI